MPDTVSDMHANAQCLPIKALLDRLASNSNESVLVNLIIVDISCTYLVFKKPQRKQAVGLKIRRPGKGDQVYDESDYQQLAAIPISKKTL